MMADKGAKRPAKAAKIANAIRRRCLSKGGSEKECDRLAIVVALSKTN